VALLADALVSGRQRLAQRPNKFATCISLSRGLGPPHA